MNPKTQPIPPVETDAKQLPATRTQLLQSFAVCVGLVLLILVVFGQTWRYQFVNYDDHLFVTENAHIKRGLTLENVGWSLTAGLGTKAVDADLWRPLSLISHMADVGMFGLNPRGHHAMNVGIHASATIALFLVLRAMTGAIWRSAFVAAVFAIHPQRVESVAWVAERKDVLCGLFFILTLGAYSKYVRNPPYRANYWLVVLMFALALASKPMALTLPFVLLLLDYWPLGRLGLIPWSRLLREKIPLFAMTLLVGLLTATGPGYSKEMMEVLPLAARAGNALVAYAGYLRQMMWPAGLAVLYPHPGKNLAFGSVVVAVAVLAAITAWVFHQRKRPYLVTGWLWYAGMLVPVIGIIQSGWQARADRYTYLPHIGFSLALVWTVAEIFPTMRFRRLVLGSASITIIAALTTVSFRQASYWRDSKTLWTRALGSTTGNYVAHNNMGMALAEAGALDEAIEHYRMAVEIRPHHVDSHYNLGRLLIERGQIDQGMASYRKALEINPGYQKAANNLGVVLMQNGRLDEAIIFLQKAVSIRPDYTLAHYNLGNALVAAGRSDEAIEQYRQAIALMPTFSKAEYKLGIAFQNSGRIANAIIHFQRAVDLNPDDAEALVSFGNALLREGRSREAVPHFEHVLALHPGSPVIQITLAWILATDTAADVRDGARAIQLAEQAGQSGSETNVPYLRTLAAAYAETGRFPEAIQTIQTAIAQTSGNPGLTSALRAELALYQAGTPFHQSR